MNERDPAVFYILTHATTLTAEVCSGPLRCVGGLCDGHGSAWRV